MLCYRYKIQQILDASTQVVAGQLIRVKAKVILSDCEKGSNKSLEQCNDKENAESKVCYFKIWSRPWIINGRETNITCENETQSYSFRSKRETSKCNHRQDFGSVTFFFLYFQENHFSLKKHSVFTVQSDYRR